MPVSHNHVDKKGIKSGISALTTPDYETGDDDDDDDDILFMLSNIIKYMQCTMKHKKETRHNDER